MSDKWAANLVDLLVIRKWARGDNPAFFSLFAGMGATMNDLADTRAVLCRYRYDALDRLAGVDSGTAEPVWRFYQKSRLSVEIQGAVRRSVFQMGDRLLAEHRLSGLAEQSELLGTDRQRSVLHAQGSQGAQSTAYSPYGHCPPATALPGFNGERRDPLTGHYLLGNGYRAYNPVLMRFNQPDSLSPFGRGGLNAYAYCQGDPVNRGDPSGHAPVLSLFNFLNEPLEPILSVFIKNTPGKELVALSATSKTMKAHVERLSIIPTINVDDPGAVENVYKALKGEVHGVLPSRLKSSKAYKSAFEEADKITVSRYKEKIDDLNAELSGFMLGNRDPAYRLSFLGLWEKFFQSVPRRNEYYAMFKAARPRYHEIETALSSANRDYNVYHDLARKIRSNLNA